MTKLQPITSSSLESPTSLAPHINLPLAPHSLFTLQRGGDVVLGVLGGTDSQTERVRRDEHHPFLVKHVLARDVGSDVSTDGVPLACGGNGCRVSSGSRGDGWQRVAAGDNATLTSSSVRVQFTTVITGGDIDLGPIPRSRDLNVEGGFDKLPRRGASAPAHTLAPLARLGLT
jgi:hypothetical protein